MDVRFAIISHPDARFVGQLLSVAFAKDRIVGGGA